LLPEPAHTTSCAAGAAAAAGHLQLLPLSSSGAAAVGQPLQESDLAEAEQQLAALSNQLGDPDEQLELLFAAFDKLRAAAQECGTAGSSSRSEAAVSAGPPGPRQLLGQFSTDYRRMCTWVQRVNGGLSSKGAAVKALRSLVQHVLQQQGPPGGAYSASAAAVSASAPADQS
jgi:hypothetical protein